MFWPLLSESDREATRAAGTVRVFERDSTLFLEGDPPSHVIIILNGRVKLTRASPSGYEILIELRGPGNVIGELGPLDNSPRIATATVVSELKSIVIPTARYQQLLLERPRITLAVLSLVSEKLRQATDRRLAAGTSSVTSRLAGRLIELVGPAEPNDDGIIEIDSPLTQQEMAEWVGASRDAVVNALRTMREFGWIDTGRRSIRIRDLRALAHHSTEAAPRFSPLDSTSKSKQSG